MLSSVLTLLALAHPSLASGTLTMVRAAPTGGHAILNQFDLDLASRNPAINLKLTKGSASQLEGEWAGFRGQYFVKNGDFESVEFEVRHGAKTSTCTVHGKAPANANVHFDFYDTDSYLWPCNTPKNDVWVVCGEAGSKTNPRATCVKP